MPSAPAAAVPDSSSLPPSPPKKIPRAQSPLSDGAGAVGDFELRHWRTPKRQRTAAPAAWAAPPAIEIPGGGGSEEGGGRGRYTSLRDILSSPEYAASRSPAACAGSGAGSCGDIHMIRNPLVKHAAYAYLQMTPSAREDPARRRRRWRGPLCRLMRDCFSFIGALFRP
ncbi:hypothetical protein GUJ93_ZPchr0009g1251 [Zizania palustris]|uniref:Uncharacterized protein n=1 Tax=Zizania palustris TaxID=103762 RepID=A0A8J5VMV1_ZIZPA|nr:hypothetical protein GUJ93_ZPchr0009g1251 [Zizania palustris]